MSDLVPPSFEKAIQLYEGFGHSPERIAQQLVRSGYPLEEVRRRFPQVPASSLPEPPQRRHRGPPPAVATESAGHGARPTQRTVPATQIPSTSKQLQGMLTQIANTRASHSESNKPTSGVPNTGTAAEQGGRTRAALSMEDGVSFQYVPLIQCSFPHTDPHEVTTFTRRNGWLELTLSTQRPDFGLPYGVPARLLTIYCSSEAIRSRSPEIDLGASVHDFLRKLDIPITRGERGSLRVYANQLLRLAHCSLAVDEHIQDSAGRQGLHIRPSQFVEEARLWWDETRGVGQGSWLILSAPLFKSILERSAPLSTAAIKQLRKSPMDLDVYAWLVHRLFQLSKPSQLTWQQLSGQFGHSYGEIRYFRRYFLDSLKRVQQVYPDAKVKVSDTGLLLLPSKPHVSPRLTSSP